MKALVVGGAGYIGSVVTRLLRQQGHEVVILDDCSTGHADSVPADVELVRADIGTAGSVLARARSSSTAWPIGPEPRGAFAR